MTHKVFRPIGALPPFSRGSLPQLETVPVKLERFPLQGRQPQVGSSVGRAPFTPKPLLDDSIASQPVGRFVLPPPNFVAGSQWKKLQVDRPTIVMALTVDTPGEVQAQATGPRILYNYAKVPDVDAQAQRSQACGTCFLSNPGTWWLKTSRDNVEDPQYSIDCLLIDASHPEVARRFLEQPACDVVYEHQYAVPDNTAAVYIPFDRYARAVTIQNVPPAPLGVLAAGEVVRYVIGQAASVLVTGGAWTGNGFRLLVNGSATFSGKALNTFGLYVCSESATPSALEVALYTD